MLPDKPTQKQPGEPMPGFGEQDRTAIVLGVGDELLRGDIVDQNTPLLARTLLQTGWTVLESHLLPDDLPRLAQVLRESAQRARLLITTGGLGPTADDLTRQAAAEAAGVEVVFHDEAWSWVQDWYARMRRPMPESNRRQALCPAGGTPLMNRAGTAPGLRMALGAATLFCLPGPPREVQSMLTAELEPWLAQQRGDDRHSVTRRVYFASLSESQFADAAGEWLERRAETLVGVTANQGRLAVTITCTDEDREAAVQRAEEWQARFASLFPELVYSLDEPDLALVLGRELIAAGVRTTAAESCTLGLVAAALGSVPGISAVVEETYCTYSYAAKERTLGVRAEDLAELGAVSEPVVRQMALGALERSGAQLAVAVSGVAGPDGGTPEKPVGLVWFAIAWQGAVVLAEARQFPPATRAQVRRWATHWALHRLLRTLREQVGGAGGAS